MTNRYVVGVDCGTSFVKATLCGLGSGFVWECATRSPSLDRNQAVPVSPWWAAVRSVLRRVFEHLPPGESTVEAISIAGITPVLVAFSLSDPAAGWCLPYWHIPDIDGATSSRLERTMGRISYLSRFLSEKPASTSQGLTDLVGYLNFLLTKRLTINAIAACEVGFDVTVGDGEVLPGLIEQGAPATHCGALVRNAATQLGHRQEGIPVCFGASDGFGSAVSAGLRANGEYMIYLGTFGSVLRLDSGTASVLFANHLTELPYTWLVSVPGLGPAIDELGRKLFPGTPDRERLAVLDSSAARAPLGARGLFMSLPYWDSERVMVGDYQLLGGRGHEHEPPELQSRAALEGVGYLIRARLHDEELASAPAFYVAGGGSRSAVWRQILATVVAKPIRWHPLAVGAGGAASIAAASIGWVDALDEAFEQIEPVEPLPEIVVSNLRRAVAMYRDGSLRP